jgi:hypothetical protein
MTTYGYARVSTDGQTLAAQQAQLSAQGCAKVYSETKSGASVNGRKSLAQAHMGRPLALNRDQRREALARSGEGIDGYCADVRG